VCVVGKKEFISWAVSGKVVCLRRGVGLHLCYVHDGIVREKVVVSP
jgi:hypothetical protein